MYAGQVFLVNTFVCQIVHFIFNNSTTKGWLRLRSPRNPVTFSLILAYVLYATLMVSVGSDVFILSGRRNALLLIEDSQIVSHLTAWLFFYLFLLGIFSLFIVRRIFIQHQLRRKCWALLVWVNLFFSCFYLVCNFNCPIWMLHGRVRNCFFSVAVVVVWSTSAGCRGGRVKSFYSFFFLCLASFKPKILVIFLLALKSIAILPHKCLLFLWLLCIWWLTMYLCYLCSWKWRYAHYYCCCVYVWLFA